MWCCGDVVMWCCGDVGDVVIMVINVFHFLKTRKREFSLLNSL
jgi:hypothetical protein